jgi:TatD DNase family protein
VLTDTHCHIDLEKFSPDRGEVLERARLADVGRILVPGLNISSSHSILSLVEKEPSLFAAVGVHPTEAAGLSQAAIDALWELTRHSKVRAIGEIGLDYYWGACPHEDQQAALRMQLALARDLGLPVVIHFREKGDAPDGPCATDLFVILESWVNELVTAGNPLAGHPGVLHSFSGSLNTAKKAIDLGFFLGVTGPVTYNKPRQELISALPLEKLLVETDAPFLAPAPHRGIRNEPANVRLIADKIALLHSCSLERCAEMTTANANRLFNWED